MLGMLDLMEVDVQCREPNRSEKIEARETEEEDKTRKQDTLRHFFFWVGGGAQPEEGCQCTQRKTSVWTH